jgi:plasmid replication initiation protein
MEHQKSIAKSNKLNMCNFKNYTKMDYLFFLFLLSKVKRYDEFGNLIANAQVTKITITAQEFAETFSIDISNAYEVLKVSTLSLQSKPIQFRDLFETDTNWTLITESSFYKSGYAEIYFNAKIWHHVANLAEKFTRYKLTSISKLDTLPAIRLFELLIQWKKSGEYIDTLENIKFSLDKESYSEYKIFKRDVLIPAITELNLKNKRLNVQFIEKKESRKVSEIQFIFNPNPKKPKPIVVKPLQPKLDL